MARHDPSLHPGLKGVAKSGRLVSAWWCPACNQCADSIEDIERLLPCRWRWEVWLSTRLLAWRCWLDTRWQKFRAWRATRS